MTIVKRTCTEIHGDQADREARPRVGFQGRSLCRIPTPHPAYVLLGDPGMPERATCFRAGTVAGTWGSIGGPDPGSRLRCASTSTQHPRVAQGRLSSSTVSTRVRAGERRRPHRSRPGARADWTGWAILAFRLVLQRRRTGLGKNDREHLEKVAPGRPSSSRATTRPADRRRCGRDRGGPLLPRRRTADFLESARSDERSRVTCALNPQNLELLAPVGCRSRKLAREPHGNSSSSPAGRLVGERNEEHRDRTAATAPTATQLLLETAGRACCSVLLLSGTCGVVLSSASSDDGQPVVTGPLSSAWTRRPRARRPGDAAVPGARQQRLGALDSRLFKTAGRMQTRRRSQRLKPVHRHIAEFLAGQVHGPANPMKASRQPESAR